MPHVLQNNKKIIPVTLAQFRFVVRVLSFFHIIPLRRSFNVLIDYGYMMHLNFSVHVYIVYHSQAIHNSMIYYSIKAELFSALSSRQPTLPIKIIFRWHFLLITTDKMVCHIDMQ